MKVVNLLRTHLDSIRKEKESTLDSYKSALGSVSYTEVQKKQLQIMEAGDDLLMKDTVKWAAAEFFFSFSVLFGVLIFIDVNKK